MYKEQTAKIKKPNASRGGQKGREGKNLEMSDAPDKVVLHDITNCYCCSHTLPKESEGYDARQIFDLPPKDIPNRTPKQ